MTMAEAPSAPKLTDAEEVAAQIQKRIEELEQYIPLARAELATLKAALKELKVKQPKIAVPTGG